MEQENKNKSELEVKKEMSLWELIVGFTVMIGVCIWIWNIASSGPTVTKPSKQVVLSICNPAPEAVINRISSGLTIAGGGSIRKAFVVKSNDYESVFFISVDLQGKGLEGERDVATFATNRLDSTGLTLSVDAVADEFSDWPLGKNTSFGISMIDDGVSDSRSCVE